MTKDSLDTSKLSRKKWADVEFTFAVDLTQADSEYFAAESNPQKLDEHLAYMASDGKLNAEVSLKWLSKSDRKIFEAAQSKEMDQWIENAVFSIAKRAGAPLDRIMSMRWILTWKDAS